VKTYICFLRAVNVSGQNLIKMAQLKTMFETLGFERVRTYLQSGNVVFDTRKSDLTALTKQIQKQILQDFACDLRLVLKTADEHSRIVTANPFLKRKSIDAKFLHATLLLEATTASLADRKLPTLEGEEIAQTAEAVYLHLPHGSGRTKLSNAFFEKALGVGATTRNWYTMTALEELCRT
jgi:uncharacterized protein (DUF1697 family)